MWDRISTSHMQEHHRAAKGAWICFLRTSKSLLLPPGQRLSKGQLLPQNVPGTPFPLSLNRDHASKYCKLLQRYFMVFGIQLLLCLACLAFRHSEGTHQRIRCHHHLCPALGQSTFLKVGTRRPDVHDQHHNSCRVHNFQELVHIILRVWKTQVVQHELHLPKGSSGSPWDEILYQPEEFLQRAEGIGHWAHCILMFIIHNALLKQIETMAVPGRNVLEEKAILWST